MSPPRSPSDPNRVRLAAIQMAPKFADPTANLDAILRLLRAAARQGAALVAFPECALTGYMFESRSEAMAVAEPMDGPSARAVAGLCEEIGATAVFGFLERDGESLYNALAIAGPGGLVQRYRKTHLPFVGVDRFVDRGEGPHAPIDAAGLRLGPLICYDGTFPEPARVLTLAGAELLLLPTNFPAGAEPLAEHVMACRAIENVVYAAVVNRVGTERGVTFVGRSAIHDPLGRTLARAGASAEEILIADLDPARARDKRIVRVPGAHEIDRIADRRPALYGPLVDEADS